MYNGNSKQRLLTKDHTKTSVIASITLSRITYFCTLYGLCIDLIQAVLFGSTPLDRKRGWPNGQFHTVNFPNQFTEFQFTESNWPKTNSRISLPKSRLPNSHLPKPVDRIPIPESVYRRPIPESVDRRPIGRIQFPELIYRNHPSKSQMNLSKGKCAGSHTKGDYLQM